MSTDIHRASGPATEASSEPEEALAPQPVKPRNEGVAVFRALLLTFLFYAALGSVIWFAWHAWHAR